ncbi:MAG: hypothetical protein U0992_21515 [Planctomycetaceae bacterium]
MPARRHGSARTILDRATGETTELVENAAACDVTVFDEFYAGLYRGGCSSRFRCRHRLAAAECAPAAFVHRLMSSAQVPTLLDIRGRELLDVLPSQPLVVKPEPTRARRHRGDLTDDGELVAAMRELERARARNGSSSVTGPLLVGHVAARQRIACSRRRCRS